MASKLWLPSSNAARLLQRQLTLQNFSRQHFPRTQLLSDQLLLIPLRFASSNASQPNTKARKKTPPPSPPPKKKAPKGTILEKPDQFRPPSHGARVGRPRPRIYDGPELTREQHERQYPHMFPNEGTVMFKILTTRGLHLWICLSTLFSLTGYVIYKDFATTTEFWHLVPPKSMLPWHPISYTTQLWRVYRLHMKRQDEIHLEKRRKKLEDHDKQVEFRRYHGLEPGVEGEVEPPPQRPRRRKVPKWFGISWD